MAATDAPVCTLELRGELTIRTATDTHHLLQTALQKRTDIAIDMAHTDDIDLTLIQLLVSAAKTARQSGSAITLPDPLPEQVSALLTRGGFSRDDIEAVR
ncbi:anti-anti-sigma regulatory factor [Rhizomicrobium palustre]|uniref:Anti-anti-sigma regulatory factor n=1 Tax=Rhizomicrobium palustre TaxID=189966 RepID=A0A846N0K3_9PROT|nr:STAS domain-containing protein [Rhizomicrobium palustre]NIK89093.1 anti-anti-sigma regulatory factor [Rhizomicrobium palustre]